MTQTDVRQCDWCGKDFRIDDAVPLNVYNLLSAGKSICLDCSDLWEDAEVMLHNSAIEGFIDLQGAVMTPTGHRLPMKVVGWSDRLTWRSFRSGPIGDAVDAFGKHWRCTIERGSLCSLTPTRR